LYTIVTDLIQVGIFIRIQLWQI